MAGVDRVTFAREGRKHYIWVCPLETKEKVGNSTVTVQDIKEFSILVSKRRNFFKIFKRKKMAFLVSCRAAAKLIM